MAECVVTSSLKEFDAVALKHVMTLPRLAHDAVGEASGGMRVEVKAHIVSCVPQAAEIEAVGRVVDDELSAAELVAAAQAAVMVDPSLVNPLPIVGPRLDALLALLHAATEPIVETALSQSWFDCTPQDRG